MSEPAAPERPAFIDRLPAFEPSDALWSRVVARRAAKERRSRLLALGSTAALAVTLALGWRVAVRAPESVDAAAMRAPALETELIQARNLHPAPAAQAREVEARLARVDAELQAAYDRRAGGDELTRLWRTRGELESTLLAAYQRPADLVRL